MTGDGEEDFRGLLAWISASLSPANQSSASPLPPTRPARSPWRRRRPGTSRRRRAGRRPRPALRGGVRRGVAGAWQPPRCGPVEAGAGADGGPARPLPQRSLVREAVVRLLRQHPAPLPLLRRAAARDDARARLLRRAEAGAVRLRGAPTRRVGKPAPLRWHVYDNPPSASLPTTHLSPGYFAPATGTGSSSTRIPLP